VDEEWSTVADGVAGHVAGHLPHPLVLAFVHVACWSLCAEVAPLS
jgi:hypothetical protein